MGNVSRRSDVGSVRLATEADLDRLSRIDRTIFPDEAYPYFVLRQQWEVHDRRFLVLEQEHELSGYALLATRPDGKQSWVNGLGIVPHARGLGLGRRLMTEGIELLTADGVAEVWLSVGPDNEIALNLYRSLGFADVRLHPTYFGPGSPG